MTLLNMLEMDLAMTKITMKAANLMVVIAVDLIFSLIIVGSVYVMKQVLVVQQL